MKKSIRKMQVKLNNTRHELQQSKFGYYLNVELSLQTYGASIVNEPGLRSLIPQLSGKGLAEIIEWMVEQPIETMPVETIGSGVIYH